MLTNPYRTRASLLFSAGLIAVLLCIPWPDARGRSLGHSIWLALRDLNRTAAGSIRQWAEFQANLNTPRAGEDVLPSTVQDALAILRGRGRAVKRYQLSPGLTSDDWTRQQMVVATWPRKWEPQATARFILNTEAIESGCTLVDRQRQVSLVYCP